MMINIKYLTRQNKLIGLINKKKPLKVSSAITEEYVRQCHSWRLNKTDPE